jgi:hypothetical protein
MSERLFETFQDTIVVLTLPVPGGPVSKMPLKQGEPPSPTEKHSLWQFTAQSRELRRVLQKVLRAMRTEDHWGVQLTTTSCSSAFASSQPCTSAKVTFLVPFKFWKSDGPREVAAFIRPEPSINSESRVKIYEHVSSVSVLLQRDTRRRSTAPRRPGSGWLGTRGCLWPLRR